MENSGEAFFRPVNSLTDGDDPLFDGSAVEWLGLPVTSGSSRWFDRPGSAKLMQTPVMYLLLVVPVVVVLKTKNCHELLFSVIGAVAFVIGVVLPHLLPMKVDNSGVSFLALGRYKRVPFDELELSVKWGGNVSCLAIGRTGKRVARVLSSSEVYGDYIVNFTIPALAARMVPFAEGGRPHAFVQRSGMDRKPKKSGWFKRKQDAIASEPQYGYLKVVVTGGTIRPGMSVLSVGVDRPVFLHSVWVANRRVSEVSVGGIAILQLTQPIFASLKTIRFTP
jgi:hypothetical protein